jgi:hypothetical protein
MRTQKLRLLLGLAVLATVATGCLTNRAIVSMKDHNTKQLMLMETEDTYMTVPFLGLGKRVVHQYWRCTDQSSSVSCAKSCGTNDLACPMVK